MSDSSAAHNSQVPLTKLAPHLAKKPQQGGFKSQVCPAFISISFSGSLWDGRLERRALLEIRADSHLAKTQLKVAPVEEQHGQLLQELAHGTPCPIARGAPHPGDMQDQHKGIHKTLPPQRRVIHSHTEQTMGKLGLQKGITATEPQSVGPGMSQTPEESREEAGVGVRTAAPGSVYWRSRCCRSPARTQRQVREQTIWLCLVMLIPMFPLRSQCLLSCREQPKTPSLAMGGRAWHQLRGCTTGAWLQGLAASLEVTAATLPALVCQRLPLTRVPTTVCCSCWNLRLMFWAQKKPKEPIFSSA